jgi:glycyl-tRNA synthetase beta chain
VFKAVSARKLSRPLDIHHRVQAVHAFAQLPEAQALAAANRRVSNILGKLESAHNFGNVSADLLVEPQEKALFERMQALAATCRQYLDRDEYGEALACLAGLRGPVDAFFDDVMVNVEDDALRFNRLNLLKQLRDLFLDVADISLLVVTK